MTTTSRDAALYLRQSHGKQRSIAEQEDDCRQACHAEGWRVRGKYTDTITASRFATKTRPDWARLLRDLEDGRFGVLVMWESSRGDRELESWAGMLRRCRKHDVLIHVVTHNRTYDMANARDWRTLAEDGVDNAYESEKTSLRIKRDLSAAAVNGRPHGIVQYGFERIYDEKTRELVEQREHKDQGPVVREIIQSLAAENPVTQIVASLNGRGIPSARGGKWTRAAIRQIATNDAYIGKRRSGVHSPDGLVLYDAMWPPIVDEASFFAAKDRLTDPARKSARPGRQKYFLSYIAQCQCGQFLFRTGIYYKCSGAGCVYIQEAHLNAYILGRLLEMLKRPEFLAAAFGGEEEDVVAARAEAQRLTALLNDYTRQAAREEIGPDQLATLTASLRPKIRSAAERARRLAAPPVLGDLLAAQERVEDLVTVMPVHVKRLLVKTLMASITVRKAPRAGRSVPTAERTAIRWVWEDATEVTEPSPSPG